MLLFKPEHVAPILSGQKTETRRIWKTARVKVGSVQLAKTQMLSKESFAKLKILAVSQERLGDISPESALNEGGYTVDAYLEKFKEINGEVALDQMVYVVQFEVIK